MPFQCGGLPRVWGCGGTLAKAADDVDEEEDLGRCQEDGRVGDVAVEGEGVGEKDAGSVGDAGELAVMTGFAGEAGEVHRQEG